MQTHADRDQVQALRAEARQHQLDTERLLKDVRGQQELARGSNGEAAYETLRQLRQQIEQLRRDEPSKRSLLLALGVLAGSIEEELARAPEVGAPLPPTIGDRVRVRNLGQVGVLQQIDERTRQAVVEIGVSPVTVALEQVESV